MAHKGILGRHPVLPGLALMLPLACTSYDTALFEFDAVSSMSRTQSEAEQLDFIRYFQGLPWVDLTFQRGDSSLFDMGSSDINEENPSGFARSRMEILADKAAGDLYRSVEVIPRLMWVGQLDRSPLNRIVALQFMSRLMEHIGLPIAGFELPDLISMEDSEALLGTLSDLNRQGETTGLARTQLVEILEGCGRGPLRNPGQRRGLIEELGRTLRLARDEELRNTARTALGLALEYGVYLIFLLNLQDDFASGIEVRRAVIHEIHRRGGPDSVAYLISLTRRPPAQVRPGDAGFDPEPYVLMELVRLCGQLNRERALRGYRDGLTPAEFLYGLVRAPFRAPARSRGPHRGLRMLALEALALSLGEPVSYEPEWTEEWYREWNRERIRTGTDR